MKKIILAGLIITYTYASNAQVDTIQNRTLTDKELRIDYIKKSKNQKTAAWIMLIGGIVTTTTGIAISASGGLDCAFGNPDCNKNQTVANVLAISGSAAMLGSIPLFIAAGKNKKKGMSLSVSGGPAFRIIKNSLAFKSVPLLTLKIGL